jgi:hypothetical protein
VINIQKRIAQLRAEYQEIKQLGDDDVLMAQARDMIAARIDELLGLNDPATDSENYEHVLHIQVCERVEEHSHAWDVTVRLPSGEVLAASLSDDMPQTPGEAVMSAGRMLDAELVNTAWAALFQK